MSDLKRSIWDWSRRADGFSDLPSTKTATVKNSKKKSAPVKRKSTDTDFSHGNIFEKLAFGLEEEKSQEIAWSSSDDEKTKKVEEKKEKITPVVKRARARRSTTPKNSAPPRRSNRSSSRLQRNCTMDVVEITDDDNFVPTSQPSQDGTCSLKSEDLGIQIFDSDSENVDSQVKTETDKPTNTPEESQVSISGVESQSSAAVDSQESTLPVTLTGTGMKGSDWLKSLQLKTPSKSEVPGESLDPEDSARKKKKYTKGGLADQLSKIQTRDKSSVRMWSHQLGKPSASQDSKSIHLEVIGFDKLYSLQLLRCVPVCNTSSQSSSSTCIAQSSSSTCIAQSSSSTCIAQSSSSTCIVQSQTEISTEVSGVGSEGGGVKINSETRLVMFPVSQAEQINLQIGSRFKIFPPWQQLDLNDGQQILLCTKYCHVIEQAEVVSKQQSSVAIETVTTTAKWNCPCVQALCRSETLCPAYQFPSTPGIIQEEKQSSIHDKDSNSNLLKSSEKSIVSHLHTVSSSSSSKSKSCLIRSDSAKSLQESVAICNSILKSIEACKDDIDSITGQSCSISFPAHIHRAIKTKDKDGTESCTLLVEDHVGTVCKICLSSTQLSKCDMNSTSCENQSYLFAGLSVKERLIREKDGDLFSMINRVWSGKCSVESQETVESQDMFETTRDYPGFCYVLHIDDYSTFSMEPCTSNILPPSQTVYLNLREILNSGDDRRVSCVVKLLLIHTKKSSRVLYVACYNMEALHQYYQIHVSSTCDISEKSSDLILIIRDLYVCQGVLTADSYSQITSISHVDKSDTVLTEEINKLHSLHVDIRALQSKSADGDLCTVQGVISEVDEDSAYSWEECSYCGSDQLQSQSSQETIECIACKKTMSEGTQKMKMEIVIKCSKSGIHAKVDLQQSTIQKLLPEDEGDDEGYELSSVLNKNVGPLNCVVISSSDSMFLLREISLLK